MSQTESVGSGHAESGPEWLWPPLPGVMGGQRLGMNCLKSGAEMAIVFVFLGPLHLAVSIYNWVSISTNLLSSVQKVDEIKFFTKDTSYSSVYTG